MSNFNEFFRTRGAKEIVDKFIKGVDYYSDRKITNLQYTILNEQPQPAAYYIENGLTATFKVDITYNINYDTDTVYHSEFEVPKEMDGVFIIEGAYRMSYNRLEPDFDCRFRTTGSGDHLISFDYERKYNIDTKVLTISKYSAGSVLSERETKIHFDNIDSLASDKRELLRLTEKQSKKLQIKLDLDYKPEYITKKLIQECIAFGDDRTKDLIIDKNIESVSSGFLNFLFRGNKKGNLRNTRSKIVYHFNRQGVLPDPLTYITTVAFRYFKGGGREKDDTNKENVVSQPGINAINLESIGNKITIPETVAYNTSFADLIDFADTPINY